MSDEEFENQEEKTFIITEEMVAELIGRYSDDLGNNNVDINNDSMTVNEL